MLGELRFFECVFYFLQDLYLKVNKEKYSHQSAEQVSILTLHNAVLVTGNQAYNNTYLSARWESPFSTWPNIR